jgi:hypothetical protein
MRRVHGHAASTKALTIAPDPFRQQSDKHGPARRLLVGVIVRRPPPSLPPQVAGVKNAIRREDYLVSTLAWRNANED